MPEVARYQPRSALDGGPDGFAAYHRLVPELPRLLAPDAVAVVEIGEGQADTAAALARQAGLTAALGTIWRAFLGPSCCARQRLEKTVWQSAIGRLASVLAGRAAQWLAPGISTARGRGTRRNQCRWIEAGRGGHSPGRLRENPCVPATSGSQQRRLDSNRMNMKRMRGRGHRPGGGGGGGGLRHHGGGGGAGGIPLNRNHVFDSNGPDLRIRGTAQQLFEKYLQLGRDATSGGDRVMAEGYFQHAEHYFRILNAINQAAQQNQQNGQQQGGPRRPLGRRRCPACRRGRADGGRMRQAPATSRRRARSRSRPHRPKLDVYFPSPRGRGPGEGAR